MNEIRDVFKIIHCKDDVYDLFQDNNWLMSRGCVDDILTFISTTSKYSPIRIVFEDKSMEVDNSEQYQFEILKGEAQDKLDRWSGKYFGISPINLDESRERITDSWSYEYAIFELVRLYKIFDWENNDLVLVGW